MAQQALDIVSFDDQRAQLETAPMRLTGKAGSTRWSPILPTEGDGVLWIRPRLLKIPLHARTTAYIGRYVHSVSAAWVGRTIAFRICSSVTGRLFDFCAIRKSSSGRSSHMREGEIGFGVNEERFLTSVTRHAYDQNGKNSVTARS